MQVVVAFANGPLSLAGSTPDSDFPSIDSSPVSRPPIRAGIASCQLALLKRTLLFMIKVVSPRCSRSWGPSTGRCWPVGKPSSIGALPWAVEQDKSCPVTCLPGLTMRWIADFYPGDAKTDARDECIAMPHTLRAIDGEHETTAGFDATWPARPPGSRTGPTGF